MTAPSEPKPRPAPILPQAAPVAAPDAPVIIFERHVTGALVPLPCTGLRMGRGLGLGLGGGLS